MEILKRILLTTTILSFIHLIQETVSIPGVDQNSLKNSQYLLSTGPLGVSFQRCLTAHVFMLGISPFILSSLVISTCAELSETSTELRSILTKIPLIGSAIHEFRLAKDEGKMGEIRIKRAVRELSLPFMLIEAIYLSHYLDKHTIPGSRLDWPNPDLFSFKIYATVSLMAGSCIIEKFANDIDENGLGDGPLIMSCIESFNQLIFSVICVWTSIVKGSIKYTHRITLLLIAILISFGCAIWLNEAHDTMHLEYYKRENFKMTYIKDIKPKPYLPLKWLPKGIYPLSLASLIFAKFGNPFIQTIGTNNSIYLTTLHPLSSLFFGFTVFIFQNMLNVGATHRNIWKQMVNVSAKIPQVRPGSESLLELKKRISIAKNKGGCAMALYATLSRLLDIWLYREMGIHLATSSVCLIACIIIQSIRQIKALRTTP